MCISSISVAVTALHFHSSKTKIYNLRRHRIYTTFHLPLRLDIGDQIMVNLYQKSNYSPIAMHTDKERKIGLSIPRQGNNRVKIYVTFHLSFKFVIKIVTGKFTASKNLERRSYHMKLMRQIPRRNLSTTKSRRTSKLLPFESFQMQQQKVLLRFRFQTCKYVREKKNDYPLRF